MILVVQSGNAGGKSILLTANLVLSDPIKGIETALQRPTADLLLSDANCEDLQLLPATSTKSEATTYIL